MMQGRKNLAQVLYSQIIHLVPPETFRAGGTMVSKYGFGPEKTPEQLAKIAAETAARKEAERRRDVYIDQKRKLLDKVYVILHDFFRSQNVDARQALDLTPWKLELWERRSMKPYEVKGLLGHPSRSGGGTWSDSPDPKTYLQVNFLYEGEKGALEIVTSGKEMVSAAELNKLRRVLAEQTGLEVR